MFKSSADEKRKVVFYQLRNYKPVLQILMKRKYCDIWHNRNEIRPVDKIHRWSIWGQTHNSWERCW